MSSESNIIIEHAVITFRNFKGEKKGRFGKAGDIYFSVFLDAYDFKGNMFEDESKIPQFKYGHEWMNPNDFVDALVRDNWLVSWWKPKDAPEDFPVRPLLKVNVYFSKDASGRPNKYGPKIWIAKKDGSLEPIDEESVKNLQTIWIDDAKIRIRPYNFDKIRNGIEDGRISAQLKDLCISPVEDDDDDDFYSEYNMRAAMTESEREDMPW